MVPYNDKVFSCHAGSFVLAIMPWNDFFSIGNQANLLLSHFLSAIKPPINLFSLVAIPHVSAGKFVLFGLKLLWLILCFTSACKLPSNDSVLLCANNPNAVSDQPSAWICLIDYWSQQGDSQVDCQTNLLVVMRYPFLQCLLFDCLLSCWLLVAFLKMYHPHLSYDSCIQLLKLKLGIPLSHWHLIYQVSLKLTKWSDNFILLFFFFLFFLNFFFLFFCMPAIHSGAAVLKTKFALGLCPTVCLACGHKEVCMPLWRFGLTARLFEVKNLSIIRPHIVW